METIVTHSAHSASGGGRRRRAGPRRAQGLVEFALTLPILLLLFGIIEFGRLFQAWVTIQNAARTAIRYAVTGQYDDNPITGFDLAGGQWSPPDNPTEYVGQGIPCTFSGGTSGAFWEHWDGKVCNPASDEDYWLRRDILRLPSITSQAWVGAAGLALNNNPWPQVDIPGTGIGLAQTHADLLNKAKNERGWFHVFICSERLKFNIVNPDDARRYKMDLNWADPIDGTRLAKCQLTEGPNALPSANADQYDPGAPGDYLDITVYFNHPLITPLGLQTTGFVALQAHRRAVNESYRTAKVINVSDQGSSGASLTPSNTPTRTNTATPTNTSTHTPTYTATNTVTPSNTPTATNTRTPSNTPTNTLTFTPSPTDFPPIILGITGSCALVDNLTFTVTNTGWPMPAGLTIDWVIERSSSSGGAPWDFRQGGTFGPLATGASTTINYVDPPGPPFGRNYRLTLTGAGGINFAVYNFSPNLPLPGPPILCATPTNTPSLTPSRTFTPSITLTPSRTFTRTNTRTPSRTFTRTNTPLPVTPPTATNTRTPSRTFTRTNTPLPVTPPTATRTNTPAPATNTRTYTPTSPPATNTRTNTPAAATNTPSRTNTYTKSPTRTPIGGGT